MKNFNYRKLVLMLADIFIIVVSAILLNFILSVTKVIGPESNRYLLSYIVIYLVTCVMMMLAFGSYSRMWRYFNVNDYILTILAMTLGFATGYAILKILGVPTRLVFTGLYYICATLGVVLFRFFFKQTFLVIAKATVSENYDRTLIVGAGQAGRMILKEIENARFDPNNPSSKILPICFVDDDQTKLHNVINGVEIIGVTADIPRICKEQGIDSIIVAVPSCEEEEKRKILEYCSSTDCKIKIVPYLGELLFDEKHTQLITQAADTVQQQTDPKIYQGQGLYGHRRRRLYRKRACAPDRQI